MSDIKSRKAELQAKVDARRKLEAEREEAAELAELEREAAAADLLDELEPEHGKLGEHLAQLNTDAGLMFVKRPHHLHYRKWVDGGMKQDTKSLLELLKPNVVYPKDWAAVETMLEAVPGLTLIAANACVKLANHRVIDVQGK